MTANIHYLRPYHEARLDDIPLLWMLPQDPPKGIVLHVPDLGQQREDAAGLIELCAANGRIAVTFDLPRHGARADRDAPGAATRSAVLADYARSGWTLLGNTVLDLPTLTTWARTRFGALPLSLSGVGFGGDAALAGARLISDVSDVTVVGASAAWMCPPDGGQLTGRPDTRALLLRQMLEPISHPGDFVGQRLHFLRHAHDPRNAAIDAFRAQVLSASAGEGGEMATTTLAHGGHRDLADPALWWPHMDALAA